jgi:hypothetical protein
VHPGRIQQKISKKSSKKLKYSQKSSKTKKKKFFFSAARVAEFSNFFPRNQKKNQKNPKNSSKSFDRKNPEITIYSVVIPKLPLKIPQKSQLFRGNQIQHLFPTTAKTIQKYR